MKKLKKYLPVIFLLLFVAVLIAVVLGVSRRGPVAPTAPSSRPSAASCLLSFDIVPPECNGSCQLDSQCGSGMTCFKTDSTDASGSAQTSGFCRNPSCTGNANCLCSTPTPTPTPTPSPTPTATPGPHGGFYIRKYFDHNGNGIQDSGDEGLTWNFQWTSDSGATWHDYQTDATKLGEGGVVYLDPGSKVEIKEKSVDGWSSTNPNDVNITIAKDNNQLEVFGNWRGATPTPTPAPGCNSSCSTNSDCPSSMNCVAGSCRNPSCTGNSNCVCTVTSTATPAPSELPKTGALDDTLKLIGGGIGAVVLGLIGLLAL